MSSSPSPANRPTPYLAACLGALGTLAVFVGLVVVGQSPAITPAEGATENQPTSSINTPRDSQKYTSGPISIAGVARVARDEDSLSKVQVVVITGTVNAITAGTKIGWSFDAKLGTTLNRETPFTTTWVPPSVGSTNYTVASRAIAISADETVSQTPLTFVHITVATLVEPTATASAPTVRKLNVPVAVDNNAILPTARPPSTPTSPPAATPTATGVPDIVKNGTFTTDLSPNWLTAGQLGASWLSGSTLNGSAARIGSRSFDSCGGVPIDAYGQLAQLVTIPNRDGVFLRFNYQMTTQDIVQAADGTPIDSFDVYVVTTAGPMPTGVLEDAARVFRDGRPKGATTVGCSDPYLSVPAGGTGSAAIDLSADKGRQVWIVFQVWNRFDGFLNSFVDLDNISIS